MQFVVLLHPPPGYPMTSALREDLRARQSVRVWYMPGGGLARTRLEDVNPQELEQRLRTYYEAYYSELETRVSRYPAMSEIFPDILLGPRHIVAELGADGVVAIHWLAQQMNFEFHLSTGRCEHGVRYHRTEEAERKVRALVLGFLSRPEEVRRRAEEYVASERGRLSRVGRELSGWEGRLADTERRRPALIDLAADGTISREDLRAKLSELECEREALRTEVNGLQAGNEELEMLEELPAFAESLARDFPTSSTRGAR